MDIRSDSRERKRTGFTLIELLVVMGIIAVLGVLTTLSYRGIAKDAKLSSGKNTVAAVLDNARGLAMKNNRIVLVAFRPRLEAYNKQRVEVVACQWSGESARVQVGGSWQVVDRFVPVSGVPSRLLPEGIKIAGPSYGSDADASWMALSHLPKINQTTGVGEAPGEIISVMFAPDGTTISRNTASDSARTFVDFDNDGGQDWGGATVDYFSPIGSAQFNGQYFEHRLDNDEPYVDVAPFIAVFDDDEAREIYDPTQWDNNVNAAAYTTRINNYSQFIANNVDPIYFNRYTGVAMK
jgi:prepilin-type N-terminal cleavage/methylation domain-containing protein